jgi:DNA topoisomerase-1
MLICDIASKPTIPKSVDKAMEKASSKTKFAPAGVSIRNGPVIDEMDVDTHSSSANGKRKARTSIGVAKPTYKDDSEEESDVKPLVSLFAAH